MFVLLLAVPLVATGCAGTAGIGGGVVLTAVGTALVVGSQSSGSGCRAGDSICEGVNDAIVEPFSKSVTLLGVTSIVVGVVMMAAGAHKLDVASREQAVTQRAVPVRAPIAAAPVTQVTALPHLAAPAEIALRAVPENRLAMQVSTLARDGHCDAAVLTGQRLLDLAPTMFHTLARTDAVFADCLAAAPVPRAP